MLVRIHARSNFPTHGSDRNSSSVSGQFSIKDSGGSPAIIGQSAHPGNMPGPVKRKASQGPSPASSTKEAKVEVGPWTSAILEAMECLGNRASRWCSVMRHDGAFPHVGPRSFDVMKDEHPVAWTIAKLEEWGSLDGLHAWLHKMLEGGIADPSTVTMPVTCLHGVDHSGHGFALHAFLGQYILASRPKLPAPPSKCQ